VAGMIARPRDTKDVGIQGIRGWFRNRVLRRSYVVSFGTCAVYVRGRGSEWSGVAAAALGRRRVNRIPYVLMRAFWAGSLPYLGTLAAICWAIVTPESSAPTPQERASIATLFLTVSAR
jgi:hypothetical protein